MALKDYIWDAEAAHQIEEQKLDKHYAANLTAILGPMIDRDSITLKRMEGRKLPGPNGRLGPQWYSWFTHYVVEQYL